jgi:hypothetical protein
MALLQIALQDGFEGDAVVVQVNGETVLDQTGVRTQHQVGAAAFVEKEVPAGAIQLRILLPERRVDETLALRVAGDTFVGLSVTPAGPIEHRISSIPFGYASNAPAQAPVPPVHLEARGPSALEARCLAWSERDYRSRRPVTGRVDRPCRPVRRVSRVPPPRRLAPT